MLCRVPSGDAAEDGAGHQARAAGVIVIEESTDDLARCIEAGDRMAGHILDRSIVGDLEAAERKRDAGRHTIGLVGRGIEALGPIGLVRRKPARPEAVADVGIERHLRPRRGVEGAHAHQKAARIDAVEPLGQRLEAVGLFFGDARDAVFLAQQMDDFLVEDLPREHACWFRISPPYLA